MLTAGCRSESQMKLLSEAETFLPGSPDSADVRLRHVNLLQLRGDAEEALYAQLRTMTDALQGVACPNDTLVMRAYSFYRRQSSEGASSDNISVRHFALSALYMGDWYASADSVKASEDCYRQAISCSERCEDWHTFYISCQRLAEQMHWSNAADALCLIRKAIVAYDKCRDNPRNLLSLYHYAAHYSAQLAYVNDGDFGDPLRLAHKSLRIAQDSCWTEYQHQAEMLLADIYWMKGDCQEALSFAKLADAPDLSTDAGIVHNGKLAQYYLICDSFRQARQLYKAADVIKDKAQAYIYARALAEIAAHMSARDSILTCMDSAFTACEAMYFDALQDKDDYYHATLEREKENERLLYEDRLKTWLFGAAIAIILLGCLFAGRTLVLRNMMQREQHSRQAEEARHLRAENELLQARQQALEAAQHKKTAAIRYLQQRIIDNAAIAMKLSDPDENTAISPREWSAAEQLLDEIDGGRISKLRTSYPSLTADDIHLCIMVRLGMSNKAIGSVYGITPSAVQHRKTKLKKSQLGVEDPRLTLDDVIEAL